MRNQTGLGVEETVACGLCSTPTTKLGTKRCDRCWELETRIKADPTLAARILGTALAGLPLHDRFEYAKLVCPEVVLYT